jgi:hypothetical protein
MRGVAWVPIEGSNGSAGAIAQFATTYGLGSPLYADAGTQAYQAFGGGGFPQMFLIGSDGTVLGRISGEADYARLDALLSLKK